MLQKAYAEGMRALVLYTATVQDGIELATAAGTPDQAAARLNDLLLPIVKVSAQNVRMSYSPSRCRPLADLIPAGLPDRAVSPRLEDRHVVRRNDGHPGDGPVLRRSCATRAAHSRCDGRDCRVAKGDAGTVS